ncbi:AP2/ERF and B3 domain-containing protein [Actinidia chinensis var. chinensis]|uniref:AP2/ERF and B3 domain-containing protein n=1 Tax=Actinidia chinensis var. chinensis TaxID=1590841 RepID=A0A2R6QSL3_ACTCC|nr:AP2/ERF and B3 domain-containing protein [Actinidia chinensis var. chinensis]
MSESRGTGTGPSDKEQKTTEDSDVQQEEEKEKANKEDASGKANQSSSTPTITTDQNNSGQEKANEIPLKKSNFKITIEPPCSNVQIIIGGPMAEVKEEQEKDSEEENPSSSSPSSMTAADTEASDKRPLEISGEENADSPSKKQKHYHSPSNVNPGPNSGDSSEAANNELQGGAAAEPWEVLFNRLFGIYPHNIELFETQLTRTNRLVIPKQAAQDFFPLSPMAELTLQITDGQDKEWSMELVYYPEEDAFVIARGWQDFANSHGLEPLDSIQFYRSVPSWATNQYAIKYVRRQEVPAETPEFTKGNFLFQLELTSSDVWYSRLFIPSREVAIHFPMVHILLLSREKEIVRFTDSENKDWYMDVILYNYEFCMIIDEWNGFVKAHGLEARDVIKFYKPVQPSHMKHFLIECVKKEGGANLTQKMEEPSQRGSNKGKGIAVE